MRYRRISGHLCEILSIFCLILAVIECKITLSPNVLNNNIVLKSPLNLTAVTWNLAEIAPLQRDCNFLKHYQDDDLVLLGLQECEDIRPRRHEGHRSRNWRNIRQKMLGKTHDCLIDHKLGGMQLSLYCKKQLDVPIKEIKVIEVPCGVGNMLSNKGAIAIVLKLGKNKSVVLINSHLAAHETKVKQRNSDYRRIIQAIIQETPVDWLLKTPKYSKTSSLLGTSSSSALKWNPSLNEYFSGALFMGDFNYRLEVPRLEVDKLHDKYNKLKKSTDKSSVGTSHIKQDMRYSLGLDVLSPEYKAFKDQLECILDLDQLTNEKKKNKIFKGFIEEEITFPPTYKYNKRSSLFDTSKKRRCPAWTDRILYSAVKKSKQNSTALNVSTVNKGTISVNDYYSLDVRTSDHRPVCASCSIHL